VPLPSRASRHHPPELRSAPGKGPEGSGHGLIEEAHKGTGGASSSHVAKGDVLTGRHLLDVDGLARSPSPPSVLPKTLCADLLFSRSPESSSHEMARLIHPLARLHALA